MYSMVFIADVGWQTTNGLTRDQSKDTNSGNATRRRGLHGIALERSHIQTNKKHANQPRKRLSHYKPFEFAHEDRNKKIALAKLN